MIDPVDRWSFFSLMAEEIESLRKRMKRKLDTLPMPDRREMTDAHYSRLIYHLREAQLEALKCGQTVKPHPAGAAIDQVEIDQVAIDHVEGAHR